MFNLPWYAWFNILAIPMVWGIILIGLKVEKSKKWEYTASSVGHISVAMMILLHWNQPILQAAMPLSYLIAAFALATFLYCVVSSIAEGFKSTYRAIKLQSERTPIDADMSMSSTQTTGSAQTPPEYVDGVFDIDDEYSCEDTEKLSENISAIFSPNKSIVDAPFMQELSGDFTDEELRDDGLMTLLTYWIAVGMFALILGPPGWMGFQVLKGLI